MAKLIRLLTISFLCPLLCAVFIRCAHAQVPDTGNKVEVVREQYGWKLLVNGKPYFIKGIEYSADTVGKYPDSNDWM